MALVTPNYSIQVVFDPDTTTTSSTGYALTKNGGEICRDVGLLASNVVYSKGVGWTLKRTNVDVDQRSPEADAGRYKITTSGSDSLSQQITYAADWNDVSHTADPGLPGLTQAVGTGLGQRSQIPAGHNMGAKLTADQAYTPITPGPVGTATRIRVAKAVHKHDIRHGIAIEYSLPSSRSFDQVNYIFSFYFNAAPGNYTAVVHGTGSYCIDVYASKVVIWEDVGTGSVIWYNAAEYATPPNLLLLATKEAITIFLRVVANKIVLNFQPTPTLQAGLPQAGPVLPVQPPQQTASLPAIEHTVPGAIPSQIPSQAAAKVQPIRIDIPAHHRPSIKLKRYMYAATGWMCSDVFALDSFPIGGSTDSQLAVVVSGDFPNDCTCTVELLYAGAAPDPALTLASDIIARSSLAATDQIISLKYVLPKYTGKPFAARKYFLRFTLASNSSETAHPAYTGDPLDAPTPAFSHSPTIWNIEISKLPVAATHAGQNIIVPASPIANNLTSTDIGQLSIQSGGADPVRQVAQMQFDDQFGTLSFLTQGGNLLTEIRLTYNADGNYSILHRGYIYSVSGEHQGRGIYHYSVDCHGMWLRLSAALTPARLTLWDQFTNSPKFAIDIVRAMLYQAGFNDSQIILPSTTDLPFRVWDNASSDSGFIEPYTPIMDVVLQYCHDYFTAYLTYEPNAGIDGAWVLIPAAAPGARPPLASFWLNAPPALTGGGIDIYETHDAYNDPGRNYNAIDHAGAVPRAFIEKKSYTTQGEPPENTCVLVIGGAATNTAQAANKRTTAGLTERLVVNVNSYNWLNLTPLSPGYPTSNRITNPDYIGFEKLLYVQDMTFHSQQAIDWMAKRYFWSSCTSRTYRRFNAPLLLIDATDAGSTRKRPLRIGDQVLCQENNGSFSRFIVSTCDPIISKASCSMAKYELVSAPTVSDYALGPKIMSKRKILSQIVKAATGERHNDGHFNDTNRALSHSHSDIHSWPHPGLKDHKTDGSGIPDIQDLIPGSATYGQFYPDASISYS